MPTVTVQPEVGDDVRMADLEGNYNFDLPTFEEALQMEKIDVPTMGKVNKAFEELPPEYEPPAYNFNIPEGDSMAPPSGQIPFAGSDSVAPLSGQITLAGTSISPETNVSGSAESLQREFQPVEGAPGEPIPEERTVTPVIPVSSFIGSQDCE